MVAADSPARAATWTMPLGFVLGALGHAIAWILYWALGLAADSPAIPAWAVLLLYLGGPEFIVAVFSAAAMVWLYAGTIELVDGGRPLAARICGVAFGVIAGALAWRWFAMDRWALGTLAVCFALPGLGYLRRPSPRV